MCVYDNAHIAPTTNAWPTAALYVLCLRVLAATGHTRSFSAILSWHNFVSQLQETTHSSAVTIQRHINVTQSIQEKYNRGTRPQILDLESLSAFYSSHDWVHAEYAHLLASALFANGTVLDRSAVDRDCVGDSFFIHVNKTDETVLNIRNPQGHSYYYQVQKMQNCRLSMRNWEFWPYRN